ncbi:VIRE2-interacting protein 1 [Canna indica]|uniref:VIRE2-interacting protein 1 n=1 Tax=Canna indica TaxID=4628 RepID=A0AAQ3JTB7_9LILI|nr:VIRE2-interacting protein 1 [Canna indica]
MQALGDSNNLQQNAINIPPLDFYKPFDLINSCKPSSSAHIRTTFTFPQIISNRQAAARSKEKKVRYVRDLEIKMHSLQAETSTAAVRLSMMQDGIWNLSVLNQCFGESLCNKIADIWVDAEHGRDRWVWSLNDSGEKMNEKKLGITFRRKHEWKNGGWVKETDAYDKESGAKLTVFLAVSL